MKTYKICLFTNDATHCISMDLRPTEAKLLERVSNLLDDAVPDDWTSFMHGELMIVEVEE